MVSEADKEFLQYIKDNEHIGYGRMMQIISYAWYKFLERKAKGTGPGAFTTTCVAFLKRGEQKEYLAGLESEEKQGMDY